MSQTDDWIWFDTPDLNDVDLSGHDVTAVVVCRNAGDWLNATLAGIGQLDRRPELVLAVDNASTDNTAELLESAQQAGLIDRIVEGKENSSFGQAVERALSSVASPTQWVWLLHDDAIPDHDALNQLLSLAARTPRLAIALPLLVKPSRRNHAAKTLEIGATISMTGRRALGLEPDEVAQGQYESSPVLGGSTCGMLIRWESLNEIGGFDRCVSAYHDGIDIGWRAHLIDQWVLTCPTARFVHRQAGRAEIRKGTIASQSGRSETEWDRLMGLRLVAAHSRGFTLIPNLIYLSIVCLLSALLYLLARAPDRAKEETQAWFDFAFRSRKPVARLRKKIIQLSTGDNAKIRVRSLRPTVGSILEDTFHSFTNWLHHQFVVSRDSDITLDDLLGDEFTRRLGVGRRRVPVMIWVLVVCAGVAVMVRGLFKNGMVTASGLLGAPASLPEAIQRAGSTIGSSEPWLLVSAAVSALTIRPTWFPVVVMVLSVPVTMLVAVWFAKHHIARTSLRWVAAAGYSCLPILMGGLNRGSLWLVFCAVILPFLVEWISRLNQPWAGAGSLRSTAGIAFSGVVLFAIVPALWIPIMIIVVVVAIRTGGVGRVLLAIGSVLVPIGFWFRSIPAYLASPDRLLLTPEPLLTPAPPVSAWQMLFARPIEAGLPPLWLSIAVIAALWLVVIVVSIRKSYHKWPILLGLSGIAIGMWVRVILVPSAAGITHPDPSGWFLVGFAILIYCCVTWIDETLTALEGSDFGAKQALVGLMSLLLVCGFILGAGWAVYGGMSQVARGSHSQVPEYLEQNEAGLDTATLIIDATKQTWNLRTAGQTLWGQGTFNDGVFSSEQATTQLREIVARMISGRPDDAITSDLGTLGVSNVVIINPSHDAVSGLDSTAGFQRITSGGGVEIWSILVDLQSPTRRMLLTPSDSPSFLTADSEVPLGNAKTLVLATPPNPDMAVFVGGVEVFLTDSSDWRAAYSLGSASGPIRFQYTVDHSWIGWVQLGALLLLLIFIIPPMTRPDDAEDRPRYVLTGGSR